MGSGLGRVQIPRVTLGKHLHPFSLATDCTCAVSEIAGSDKPQL